MLQVYIMEITKSKHWYAIKKMIPGGVYEPMLTTYYRSRSILYRGDKVHCPVCEKSFREFINGHSCPYCGSGRRHRLLFLFLQRKTNFLHAKLKVLHFAPEHCFYKKFAQLTNLDYKSADLNSSRAMESIDMTNIQYADNTFDVVISSHVLEHVPEDAKAMSELYRVMKPGNWSIHQAPIDYSRAITYEDASITSEADRLKHFGHMDHKRVYGRDYKERLQRAGFEVIEDGFAGTFSDDKITTFGLDKWEKVYFCKK